MSFDAERFKREERFGYNLIAARYAEGAALRADLNAALIAAADLHPGQRLLDVASGPGVLAREAAARLGGGLAVASDIADGALREGRDRARADGLGNLAFVAADAERLCFPEASFDRLLCGLGLMFFPEAPRALAAMCRVLRPGGRAAFSVWGEAARTPLVACALDCLARVLPPPRVARLSPFRFGAAAALGAALRAAGFSEVEVRPLRLSAAFPSSTAYWQAFRDLAGGAAAGLSRLPAETHSRLAEEVARELAPWRRGDGYLLESETLIACGRRV